MIRATTPCWRVGNSDTVLRIKHREKGQNTKGISNPNKSFRPWCLGNCHRIVVLSTTTRPRSSHRRHVVRGQFRSKHLGRRLWFYRLRWLPCHGEKFGKEEVLDNLSLVEHLTLVQSQHSSSHLVPSWHCLTDIIKHG